MIDPSIHSPLQPGQRLPSGTITFLFTDIEGSTQLWEKHPNEMKSALALHDSILRESIEFNHGVFIKTTGDGIHAVFEKAIDAVQAAAQAQQHLHARFNSDPSTSIRLKARMGIHTGEADLRDGDYYGQSLNRAARLMSVAHGEQILLSAVTCELAQEHLPADVFLLDVGEHHLKDLARPEHIYQLNVPGLPAEFPALKTINLFPNNLPLQLSSFIGREKEIEEIRKLITVNRMVTLTGSGGTGKTRLSIEVGRQELSSFVNGVWLVELAPLSDPAQIVPTMAQAFGLQELPTASLANLLQDYLRHKKLLLLLDNCEHLIEACARLADTLLHQCAGLKILASSREALGIAGEVAYHTPSLARFESTQLFIERARATNSGFRLTEDNEAAVAQICTRLDGIPLAIELAAARTRLLSVDQIAARLDDLFRLLVGGSRTALPRQQTLRALIDWSYDLLSNEEKALFRFASVFVGGWTFDALEAVSEDPNVLENLEQLVNKSLVVTEERGSEMRYYLLETIRQYAREKLFDSKQVSAARDRHFFYFETLAETMWEVFRSADMLGWRHRADDEAENLRAAIEWGLDRLPEDTLRLAAYYCVIASWVSKQTEGIALVQSALDKVRSLPPAEGEADLHRKNLIARGSFTQGMVNMGQGNMHLVIQALQEAIALSRETGDKLFLGYSLEMFFVATNFIRAPRGPEAVHEGLRIFSGEVHDSWGLSMAYQNMVRLATERGDQEEKKKYFNKLKELLREVPLSFQAGLFFLGMGMGESVQGNYEDARQLFEEGLRIFERIENKNFQTALRSELGHIARRTGDLKQAREIYQKTLVDWQDLGNRSAISHQLECFGFLAIADEEPRKAARLFGAAEVLREQINSIMTDHEQVEYGQAILHLRSMLTLEEFTFLWAEGRTMTMEQAIQLALGRAEQS
jgi:predicted ATPase/class 3 adenylate cyclase